MKFLVVILFVVASVGAGSERECNKNCKREKNCVCPSLKSPLSDADTPQFVTLTFDDPVTKLLYTDYLSKLFANRTNPDGTPITATFYVPHEYSDYQIVNDLYNKGHEIALHSVSKQSVDYWKTVSERKLAREFSNNRRIITNFAGLPERDLVGARTPHLQISGDKTFSVYKSVGIKYDSSWVTTSNRPFFPFTLDYPTNQECLIGEYPTKPYRGLWVLPIVNLLGKDKYECNALAACQIEGSAWEIGNWLISEFQRVYYRNKAPMTLMVNLSWFQMVENSFEGLKNFLDYVQRVRTAYVVSHSEVLNWAKRPVAVKRYRTNYHKKRRQCKPSNICSLKLRGVEERIMSVCGTCPKTYPWLGNPEGKL
ncbi:hypothetical protein FQR65_LT11449 [Abscondita terminalis]|nr:hypothetical protein FQR65_LT11449 [Abscondita terminalis]